MVPPIEATSRRNQLWASTMAAHELSADVASAHPDPPAVGAIEVIDRLEREHLEAAALSPGATRSHGSGNRLVDEEPDPLRTCFERDRDRILHSTAFRRLAGKTQVFVSPTDHQRTRLTHALEVSQVATAIARALGLNTSLVAAAAEGHDCGHGPGGHPSEDAFALYLPGGYDHAVWGADVVLAPLNLCVETLDAIRNHSWSRPTPLTPEGEVVSWADRIAYVCHDFEDAVSAGLVQPHQLPAAVRELCGDTRSQQLRAFIKGVIEATVRTGRVGMTLPLAQALGEFRRANYELIYMRSESREQAIYVHRLLCALVEHFAANPTLLPASMAASIGAPTDQASLSAAVTYVAGMTDRFALQSATRLIGWSDQPPASWFTN